jgi:excisionase family DNA binding protein
MDDQGLLAYRPENAARKLDIGRTTLYGLMASGELETIKVGRARLVPAAALDRFILRLVAAQADDAPGGLGR